MTMFRKWHQLLVVALAALGLWQSALAQESNPKVKVETDVGAFVIELYLAKAPKSVANFLQYVDSGFYDNTIFHRVIPGFVVQGGGLTADMQQKPTKAPIENEAKNGLKNETATLSMARTQDPNSASSQFFINLRHNDSLDYPSFDGWGYAVFGKVVDGMATIRKIEGVKTGTLAGHRDVPVKPITLLSARRVAPTAAK